MADAPKPPAPKNPLGSMAMMLTFVAVMIVMFNETLRNALASAVGFVFNPIIAFPGAPLWTVFLAGVLMILATTVLRHFLVDWIKMAKSQEVMRTFQREFSEARKSNNTYKIKRLTEMQPELMQMQAELSTDQMKPMVFTMLLVIPIFAWLLLFSTAPVPYGIEVEGAGAPLLFVALDGDLKAADYATGPRGELSLVSAVDVHALTFAGASPASGSARLTHPHTERAAALDASAATPVDLSKHKVGTLSPGTYDVQPADPASIASEFKVANPVGTISYTRAGETHHTQSFVLVVVPQGADLADADVRMLNGHPSTLTIERESEVYAFVPIKSETTPTGRLDVWVRAPRPQDEVGLEAWRHNILARWEIEAEDAVVALPAAGASAAAVRLTPHSAALPWNPESDLTGAWKFLPHWILLYSLFSIPFGTLTQKVLKLWEYSKVDLDGDGKPAGKGA